MSRFRASTELGHFLTTLVRVRSCAREVELWVRNNDGRLRALSGSGELYRPDELGFSTLPTSGPAALAPASWRGRLAFRALPLRFGDAQIGVLALGFSADPPPLETLESDLRDELLLWALCLDRLLAREALQVQGPSSAEAPRRDSGIRARAQPRRARVLLADSDAAAATALARRLESTGHEVVIARDGVELLSLAASITDLEIIITDLNLPRRAGPTMVAALRRVAPTVSVVVIAEYASDEMSRALRAMGVLRVLRKPVDPTGILAALDSAAARRAG